MKLEMILMKIYIDNKNGIYSVLAVCMSWYVFFSIFPHQRTPLAVLQRQPPHRPILAFWQIHCSLRSIERHRSRIPIEHIVIKSLTIGGHRMLCHRLEHRPADAQSSCIGRHKEILQQQRFAGPRRVAHKAHGVAQQIASRSAAAGTEKKRKTKWNFRQRKCCSESRTICQTYVFYCVLSVIINQHTQHIASSFSGQRLQCVALNAIRQPSVFGRHVDAVKLFVKLNGRIPSQHVQLDASASDFASMLFQMLDQKSTAAELTEYRPHVQIFDE